MGPSRFADMSVKGGFYSSLTRYTWLENTSFSDRKTVFFNFEKLKFFTFKERTAHFSRVVADFVWHNFINMSNFFSKWFVLKIVVIRLYLSYSLFLYCQKWKQCFPYRLRTGADTRLPNNVSAPATLLVYCIDAWYGWRTLLLLPVLQSNWPVYTT